MSMEKVGVKELKNRLAHYLRLVRKGRAVVVTVHLAAAWVWQEALGYPVTMATFDRELWTAAKEAGLNVWPETWE